MFKTGKQKRILLVEPRGKGYHAPYPPVGLLKLATYHNSIGNNVKFIKSFNDKSWFYPELITLDDGFYPDEIYITSLFTYAWKPVHEVIRYYSEKYAKAEIIVGGIYATLCENHLIDTFKNRIKVHKGVFEPAEDVLPDYSLFPEWKESIIISSRGCIRNCPFCVVKALEPEFKAKKSIKNLVYPGHNKVVVWDNNILSSPYWEDIFDELIELKLEVDFNQGIDARLLNLRVASKLKMIKIRIVRLSYDSQEIRMPLKRAIDLLKDVGFHGKQIMIYCLYNNPFEPDTPEIFLNKIQDLIEWGVVSYPMRYEPPEPRLKNTYVSPYWTADQLEMIAKARRVVGYGGAFPPYEGLKRKFLNAKYFEEAFKLNDVGEKENKTLTGWR